MLRRENTQLKVLLNFPKLTTELTDLRFPGIVWKTSGCLVYSCLLELVSPEFLAKKL